MNAMEDKMESQESQVGVRDGRKGEGMIRYANGRQDLMTANENQIVVYQPNETVRLDVRLENETVWLTQAQLCELFGVVKSNISYHLKNIYGTNELDYGATVQKIRTVRLEAGRNVARDIEYFNLDVIISLGYRINSKLGIQFRQWATRVLKEFLLRGYSVNSRLNQLEDRMDRRLAKHDDDIAELKDKVDFFVQIKEPPLHGIFYQGRYWDAKSLLIKFIRRAKKELIVIDAYVGVATLDMLAKRGRGVKIELVTHSNGELEESDFEAFGKQCGKFSKTICGICHDRFIIVDGKEVFWTGASLKDAGRLTFAAAKMGAEIIPGLLDSIRKATTDRGEYDILDISLDLAYAVEPIKRSMRAQRVEAALAGMNAAQAALVRVILANYVSNGVWTLTREGYRGLLASKYGSLISAKTALGFASLPGLEDFYLKLQDFLYAA